MTVKVRPAIVSVPVRDDALVFAATLKPTVPFPEPAAPDVIVIQAALLTALHAQPALAVTPTVPEPPAAATDWDVALIVGAHGDENVNVFETALGVLPPGPTAETRDS